MMPTLKVWKGGRAVRTFCQNYFLYGYLREALFTFGVTEPECQKSVLLLLLLLLQIIITFYRAASEGGDSAVVYR